MSSDDKGFDGQAFYNVLTTVVDDKKLTWKQVSIETGVSASTLARMSQSKKPDAASLAALSAWAGLNPSDFVTAPYKKAKPETLAQISTLLRTDPSLDDQAAEAMESIFKAAYERLKK